MCFPTIHFHPRPPPHTIPPSFCCLSKSLARFSSPPPPRPHTFSHLLSPSTPAVSLILVPPLLPAPYSQLVQYSSLWVTVRQISSEGGALPTLKATLYGQQCMQHTAAVRRLCVNFWGFFVSFLRESDKLYRACHLWVKELIAMNISCRIQLGGGGGGGGGGANTPQTWRKPTHSFQFPSG